MAECAETRFWRYVEPDGDCWKWSGARQGAGYGLFHVSGSERNRVRMGAHRWAFEHLRGEIPVGLELDHLCRNRLCVNPDHLDPVPHLENHRRRIGFPRKPQELGTHCQHGHERTPESTGVNKQGSRFCRPCARLKTQRYQARRRINAQ